MDKSPESYQWLVIFLLHMVIVLLLSQLNQTLATVSLFLFINGLLVTFPALFLPFGQGIVAVILLSIFYDSGESWDIGTSLIPYLITFVIIYYTRPRIRYQEKNVFKSVVLVANLALFVYYTVLAGTRFGTSSSFVLLNLTHLVFSQLVLYIFSGWFQS
ncbi:MAG: hypothetical protein KJT03_15860, partial [Verrucomicrobiae bacterium]|nr:hypothetical protein [Verrucomicrobiae bacterium]